MKLEKFHEAKNEKRAMTAKWITAVATVAALGFAIARLVAVGRRFFQCLSCELRVFELIAKRRKGEA